MSADHRGAALRSDYPIVVLLVDDQPIVGEAVRRALSDDGDIRLHYCADPAIAVAHAMEIAPTVILQDLVMPGVDGLSMVRRFRVNPGTSHVPIILLSTTEDAAVKSAAFSAGANDYIVKLPDRIELIARIRHHSKSYLNQIQRDEAYAALQDSQRRLLESNRELQRLNNLDGLTGLSNRRHVNEFIATEWKRAIREQVAISVLMVDVDEFKRYNDSYGHLAGDDVLRQVAKSIQATVNRPTDLAARFGGEEFVAVLPSTTRAGAHSIAEKMRAAIEALAVPHQASSCSGHVTVSVGGASMVPRRGEDYSLLIDAADAALYEAKRAGRNRAVLRDERA
jgi:two-component system chemotaxis family response regulator WspR